MIKITLTCAWMNCQINLLLMVWVMLVFYTFVDDIISSRVELLQTVGEAIFKSSSPDILFIACDYIHVSKKTLKLICWGAAENIHGSKQNRCRYISLTSRLCLVCLPVFALQMQQNLQIRNLKPHPLLNVAYAGRARIVWAACLPPTASPSCAGMFLQTSTRRTWLRSTLLVSAESKRSSAGLPRTWP